jgi:hypothetical protein
MTTTGERLRLAQPAKSEKQAPWLAALAFLILIPRVYGFASLSNESITGYTGILLQNAGMLAPLTVEGDYFVNNFTVRSVTQTWRIGFQLLDDAGNTAVPETFTDPFTTVVPAHGQVDGAQTATLTPASVTSGTAYHLSVQLYGQSANPPGWVAVGGPSLSDAYRFQVADAAAAAGLVGWLNTTILNQSFAVATVPGAQSFQVEAKGVLGRYAQLDQAASVDNYQLSLDLTLTGANTGPIALTTPHTSATLSLATHTAAGAPASAVIDQMLNLQPTTQLDSTDNYTIGVTFSYAGPDNVQSPPQTITLTGQRLLHFNGTVRFGAVTTTITQLSNQPEPLGTMAGVGENTTLGISGILTANPAFTFTTGADLSVMLNIDGSAMTSDSVDVTPPTTPDASSVNGVRFTRDTLSLDGTGAHASVTVQFPAGFGVSAAPNLRRLQSAYPAGTIDLDASLNPVGPVNLSPSMLDALSLYAVHEQLPEMFKASGITWNPTDGTFTVLRTDTLFIRRDEIAALEALPSTDQTTLAKDRPSNDGYLNNPASDSSVNLIVSTDSLGRAILASAQIDLPPSSFVTHFPANVTVAWTQPGLLIVQNGMIDPTQSSLPGASDTIFSVSPGAPSQPPPVDPDRFTFSPDNGIWSFTPDGGLHADGTLAPAPLRWGARDTADVAQATDNFLAASAHLPGPVLRGALATTSIDNRPGELLFSGQGQPGNPGYVERPGAANYASGLADYAGLNFRVASDRSQMATSLIGDATAGPYPLAAVSKYYARSAGVSGIHAAVASSFASQASALVMYGFPLSLTSYQLSFLDNTVQDSLVSGTVNVPGPRGNPGFSQPFSKLSFDAKGHPTELTLAQPNNFVNNLAYWNAQFRPLGAEFLPKPASPSTYALVFGAELLLPNVVKDPIRGGIGFFSDGHLVAASDGIAGVNSRFKPPKQIRLHGTGSVLDSTRPGFTVHPVTDLYLNDPNAAGAPNAGFAAFAGTVQVPFFQDIQVHVLARAGGTATRVRAGWSEAGSSFFNNAQFDASNRGFPPGLTSADYENDAEPAGFTYFDPNDPAHQQRNPYNPLASQSWMGFVNFSLPITWDPALRRFVSSVPEQRDFLVFNSQRVLQQLTPSGAEIRFGLQFNGLPRLNLAALVIDDQEATGQLIQFIPNGPRLVAGLQAFDKLLNNQSDELISQGLDFVLDQFLDDLFQQGGPLQNALSAADAVQAIGTSGSAQFAQVSNQLMNRLSGVVGTVNDANSVMKDINDALVSINGGLSTADTLLAKDAQGKRGALLTQTLNLAESVGLPADDVDTVSQTVTTLINGDLASTLDEMQNSLNDVHSLTASAQGLVGNVQAITQSALETVNTAGALPDQVLLAMRDYFNTVNDPTGRLLAEMDPQTLRANLKRIAHDTILQSGFIPSLQSSLRDLIGPVHDEYGALFQQIFGVINEVVRSSLQELSNQVIDHLNDSVGQLNRTIGGFSDTLRLTQVEGSARIVGNVLDSAHINGELALHVPDPISLLGAIDFKHLRGDQPVPGCAAGTPDGRMQITLSGQGNASIAGSAPVHAVAQGQYTMTQTGAPLAVAGKLSVDSDIHFDAIGIKHAEFDFAFGAMDNYLRAEGAGTILLFDVDARCFLGRTCDADLLNWLDPQINDVFKALAVTPANPNHAVTGYYFRGDGDVVLNRLFEIPDNVVTLKGKGGQGSFVFADDNLANVIPGQHWRFGITVGLGPVSAGAELNALGGLNPLALLKSDNVANIALSLFTNPGLIQGAIRGTFTPTFQAGPISWSKDFNFTAYGGYTPPPLAPPPGFFFIDKLDF